MTAWVSKKYLSQEGYRAIFDYDQESGTIKRKVKARGKQPSGHGTMSNGYLSIRVNSRHHYIHRIIWIMHYGAIPEGFYIDHINGIKTDNRIVNMRLATSSQNGQNIRSARSHNESGVLGVSYRKDKRKFSSEIMLEGKRTRLGYFEKSEEAQEAYINKKREIHEYGTI